MYRYRELSESQDKVQEGRLRLGYRVQADDVASMATRYNINTTQTSAEGLIIKKKGRHKLPFQDTAAYFRYTQMKTIHWAAKKMGQAQGGKNGLEFTSQSADGEGSRFAT